MEKIEQKIISLIDYNMEVIITLLIKMLIIITVITLINFYIEIIIEDMRMGLVKIIEIM